MLVNHMLEQPTKVLELLIVENGATIAFEFRYFN